VQGDQRYTALPPEVRPETGPKKSLPPQFRRTLVDYYTKEPAGTLIIDTPNTYLYLVLGQGKALRYGIGVGREGFTWTGAERVSKMAEWPDWHPPEEMIDRQPYLPRFMAGGDGNPLGARALYLGKTLYRIHGTNQPSTIGTFVSSGCIRLTNDDITDLYLFLLDHPEHTGIYNAGFENISILDIANLVAKHVKADIVVTPSDDPRSYRVNSDRLLATGFRPKKTVEDAIKEIIGMYSQGQLKNEDRWYNLKWMEKDVVK